MNSCPAPHTCGDARQLLYRVHGRGAGGGSEGGILAVECEIPCGTTFIYMHTAPLTPPCTAVARQAARVHHQGFISVARGTKLCANTPVTLMR